MTSFMTVDQARASVRRLEGICKIRPTAENCIRLSTCYFILNDMAAALTLAELAFSKNPNDTTIALNLGLIYKDLGQSGAAHKCFKVAYELAEEDWYVRLAYSESILKSGMENWGYAWPIFDDARPAKEEAALNCGIPLNVPMWNGKQRVEELIVLCDGGVGDIFTYCRWLNTLTCLNIYWRFFPPPELRGFFERASWCGKEHLVNEGSPVKASHWTTIFSLPANLNAGSVPLLLEDFKPLPQLVTKYKLARNKLPVVGLCWQGDEEKHGGRKVHSMTEGQAMRLVCRTDHLVNWVNLQYHHPMPPPVTNVKYDTWEELAGLIANLDAVVSVETGPMCLADAMGKTTAAILSSNSDWKFGEEGDTCAFYPNTYLVRNGPGGGMENAIDKAIELTISRYEKPKLTLVGD